MGALIKMMRFFFVSGIGLSILVAVLLNWSMPPHYEIPETGYWGQKRINSLSKAPKDDLQIYKFRINYPQATIDELKKKLGESKFVAPLEESQFHYGFNHLYLKMVVDYWKTKFDWKKQEAVLNQFNHYITQIEGIDIHFMHAKKQHPKSIKVVPLMLIHGWPGSIVEFLDIVPMLTTAQNGTAFEVICPSIPGYAFSEPAHKQGMNVFAASRIFVKLMKRLGFEKFYVHGGDWGAVIAPVMAQYYPQNILGMHSTMAVMLNPRSIRDILYKALPSVFDDENRLPETRCLPDKFIDSMIHLLTESGYFHIQSTKPDTVGTALLNSPVGLAAYILEKFSTWTNRDYRNEEDGGLTKKFTMDRLLTNVMIYHLTSSIVSSQRFYKENIGSKAFYDAHAYLIDENVPVGITVPPHEIICNPSFIAKARYPNITTFTYLKKGGHFLAMEEPKLLHDDIRTFVQTVENLYPRTMEITEPFKYIVKT